MRLDKVGSVSEANNGYTTSVNAKTKDLVNIFNENNIQSIVVLDQYEPVGLVMRDKLFYRLGSRFGYNLYMEKSIVEVMDSSPLIVDYNQSIFEVSRLVTARSQEDIYDSVIVIKNNNYYSTISIRDLLVEVSELKVKEARDANPLTGLPGNNSIKMEIKKAIKKQKNFSVLYIDLDNFKAYNDNYGYQKGDEVLKFTVEILKKSAASISENVFIGHVGGDDFVLITESKNDEKLAGKVIDYFDLGVQKYFNQEDLSNGHFICLDRQHNTINTPLTSISIAIVTNENQEIKSHIEVSDQAAELKKIVKEKLGSNYFKNRRKKKDNAEYKLCQKLKV